jgi:hypothetical protein
MYVPRRLGTITTELPQRRRRVSGNDTAMANEQYDPVLSGALGPLNRSSSATVLMVSRVTIAECQVCAELRLLGDLFRSLSGTKLRYLDDQYRGG